MATKRPGEKTSSAAGPTDTRQSEAEIQETLVYMQCCGQEAPNMTESNGHRNVMTRNHQVPVFVPRGRAEGGWTHPSAPQQTTTPTVPSCPVSAPYSFRSPESVEMDEIMAAMVLTSMSCSPVVQSSPQSQNDPVPGPSSGGRDMECGSGDLECGSGDMECGGGDMECGGGDMECGGGDMECGGGELSDSGSSGYWSRDHDNVSPVLSLSVMEMDSSPDEGLHTALEQGVELNVAKRSKSSFRGAYRCLWPSCGKVLTSSVGMKRHVRVLHLGASEQSHREEDFYYTDFSCRAPPALVPASHVPWASCGSPPGPGPGSGLQIPSSTSSSPSGSGSSRPSSGPGSTPGSSSSKPSSGPGSTPGSGSSRPSSGPGSTPGSSSSRPSSRPSSSPGSTPGSGSSRPSSRHSSGPGSTPGSAPDQPSPLSQSAPSSFSQIQTDHLYQACAPLQVTVSCHNPAPCCWTPPPLTVSNQPSHHNSQVVRGRCRSVSVGEQWLQQNSTTNRLTPMRAASPSRSHCSFRKGRGEAKKCRKVYGVERKEQWCTACRWKKACQRFPD
ncbi:zinc finger protein 395-like isoform X2 [Salvelinus fontinalis]|uniref:zinc finger protein 395-like isoform X2 n=1 Tax=Salvelinus fontinalis TaxID=8038 RepID=UPI002485DB20|nr:zinc finger protein 395-like isoform X2 [Salvelinus fontinalis]